MSEQNSGTQPHGEAAVTGKTFAEELAELQAEITEIRHTTMQIAALLVCRLMRWDNAWVAERWPVRKRTGEVNRDG